MAKNGLKILRCAARWFLLIGVFAGICFSGGEGVQLFPFESAPPRSEKSSEFLREGDVKHYVASVHNLTSYSLAAKFKSQKSVKDFVAEIFSGAKIDDSEISLLSAERGFDAAKIGASLICPRFVSDRAPPAV
jgi:hypothetical protein